MEGGYFGLCRVEWSLSIEPEQQSSEYKFSSRGSVQKGSECTQFLQITSWGGGGGRKCIKT